MKQHIEEVAEGDASTWSMALEPSTRAPSDHTVPRAELVAAVEKIAQKSPTMKRCLKSIYSITSNKAGDILVKKAIDYVLG